MVEFGTGGVWCSGAVRVFWSGLLPQSSPCFPNLGAHASVFRMTFGIFRFTRLVLELPGTAS